MKARLVPFAAALAVAALLSFSRTASAAPGATERVNVDSAGMESNGNAERPSVSGDGRFVAFQSTGDNLVAGDTNATTDVFVHDRLTDSTERVSVSSAGAQTNNWSDELAISENGRVVAFQSAADNLVSGDTNSAPDIFVRDRLNLTTERISVDSSGSQAEGGGGGFAANSFRPAVNADGRFVAFQSWATNLVAGDTNSSTDIFVHDRFTGATERVTVGPNDEQSNGFSDYPAISADGRFVAFLSAASNLVAGDTNGLWDAFVHDRSTGITERVSVSSAGTEANGPTDAYNVDISADGRYVAFESTANNLVPGDTNGTLDVFVHDRSIHSTERVSVTSVGGQASSQGWLAISGDGMHVAFTSASNTLVPGDNNGDYDVFVRDRTVGLTERVSVDGYGSEGNQGSDWPDVSFDGQYVTFWSRASNFVSDDTNSGCPQPGICGWDIFLHEQCVSSPDCDGDGLANLVEVVCGGTSTNPSRRPERIDGPFFGLDDNGDTQIDEPLPSGADAFDCDGDGYVGTAEAHVFSATTVRDQDACGTDAWPADLIGGMLSANKVDIQDLSTFIAPVRQLNTNVGDNPGNVRWDLVAGKSGLQKDINIVDLTNVSIVAPPMLGGVRAFNGPDCPWPP